MSLSRATAMLALAATLGCATERTALRDLLPSEERAYFNRRAVPRLPPIERARQFDATWRSGGEREPRAPYDVEYAPAPAVMAYPMTARQGAVLEYISLGDDFTATGDDGGASRAYWAAIHLTRHTLASRQERERNRALAFNRIAAIYARRGAERYRRMMRLCRDLSATYAQDEEGNRDRQRFFGPIARLREALDQIAEAEARRDAARSASIFSTLGSILAVGVEAAANAGNVSRSSQRSFQNTLQNLSRANAVAEQSVEALRRDLRARSGAINSTASRMLGEVRDEDGWSFSFAQHVASMVTSVRRIDPYIPALTEYAGPQSDLLELVNAYIASRTDDRLIALIAYLQQEEDAVTQAELMGDQSVDPIERSLREVEAE
jgi:hypothetical protein